MFQFFVRAAAAGAIIAALAAPAFAHHGVMHDGCAPGQGFTIGAITVTGAFTRAMLPGAEIAGGYMSIANSGNAPDRLLSVTTEAAKESGLHQMSMEGDVMKMAPLEGGLEIPAGASVTLEPGGNHVMMEGIDQRFEEGECVRIVLHFETAGDLAVDLSVGGVSQDAAPIGHEMADMAMHSPTITLGDLEITGPFTRATLPNAPVGAGFMVITNHGSADDRLVSATSPVAGMTQIHEMRMEGDVMKMAELPDGLVIPAGGSVTLAPGGFHIMFMDLKQSFVEGTSVPVTLTFERAGSIEVLLAVGTINADAPGGHEGHADNAGHVGHDSGMQMDMSGMSDTDAIAHMQKAMFDTPDDPLEMGPIIVVGDYAISDWAQKDVAGRALLRKTEKGWGIHLCSGAGLKDAANLATIGVPAKVAAELAKNLGAAESTIDPALLARYDSFDGTMMADEGLI